jgi:F-type H+-transporting ATPase subunit gamma
VQTAEELRQKMQGADDLLSVVKTMKGLAAVNIRHFERAVESLGEYSRTVEMGLHIVLNAQNQRSVSLRGPVHDRLGVVLFGTDQGLCGQFNERIVDYALNSMDEAPESQDRFSVLAVGSRATGLLDDAGLTTEAELPTPGGIAGISPLVQELLFHIEGWRIRKHVERILIFNNRPLGTSGYDQNFVQLLPVDLEWLRSLAQERWPSRSLPTYTMEWDDLFAALIRQYMFIALYRACAESLAAENAARVVSMQNAESNIEERLTDLERAYQRQRQNQITAELLDIVSGYDAVMNSH